MSLAQDLARALQAAEQHTDSARIRVGVALDDTDTAIQLCSESGLDAQASGLVELRAEVVEAMGLVVEANAALAGCRAALAAVKLVSPGEVGGQS